MKFYCDQCNAQYFIADAKIGAKGVKVRCKRCDNVIIIRPPAADESPADAAPPTSDDPLAGLGGDTDEPAAPVASAPSSGLGLDDLDLGLDDSAGDAGIGFQASTASSGDNGSEADGDDLLIGGADGTSARDDRSTVTESAGAPAVAMAAAPARRPPTNVAASGGMGGEDALDSELAGAFDSVFGAAPVDPFNTVEITGAPDRSKRETRFYSPQEMAQVEHEKQSAHDDDDLMVAAPATSAPGFGLKPGGNGNGEDEDDLLASSQPEPPPSSEDQDPVWYVAINEQQVGPISMVELSERWDRREVDGDSLIWKSSLSDWMPVRDVPELRSLVSSKSAARRDLATGAATEVERPRNPAAMDPFDAAAALDHSILGNASMPSDTMNDPFATVESSDLPPPGGIASGSWRPHGMTEIYQAASLAEASSQQPLPPPDEPVAEEEVDWNPGAAAALASLVDDEIKSVAVKPSGGFMPTADDNDLQLAPEGKSSYGDLLSAAPLPTPRAAGSSLPMADPFAAQISASGTGEVDIAQIAGQSSMVMQRPSYLSEPPKAERKINWLLWGGIGAGAVVLIMFVLLIVVLVKVISPAPQPAVATGPGAAVAGTNTPAGTPPGSGQPGGTGQANNPGTPANTGDTPGVPASQPRAADQLPVAASPPIGGDEEPAEQEHKKKVGGTKKPAVAWTKSTGTKSGDDGEEPVKSAAPEPKPTPAPAPGPKGKCDPILFPDGVCPSGTEGPVKTDGPKATLSKAEILMTVKKNMPGIKACTAEQAKRDKRLATGELKMSWYVRADGKTKNVSIVTSKFKGTYIGTCMTDAISKWQFPSFEGEDVGPIKFPFSLE